MENLKKEIEKLIEVYKIQKNGYDSMLDEMEKKIDDLDHEGTETYGVYLGKSELYEVIIDDLKKLI